MEGKGTWTCEEHARFLQAMQLYPKGPWKAIAAMVGTRTVRQTQTHAQKYREKIARRMRGLRNRNGTLRTNASLRAAEIMHQTTFPPLNVATAPNMAFPFQRAYVAPAPQQASSQRRMDTLPQFPYRNAQFSQSAGSRPSPTHNDNNHHHRASQGAVRMLPQLQGSQMPSPSQQGSFQSLMKSSTSPCTKPSNICNSSPRFSSHSIARSSISPSCTVTASLASPGSLSISYSSRQGTTSSSSQQNASANPQSHPASTKKVVPDFNESMDFFMEMYHYNPETLAVPTSSMAPRVKTIGV